MAKKNPTYKELKALLEKRTAELAVANETLQHEITARKLAETELQKHKQPMSGAEEAGVWQDSTERNTAEEKLRESEAYLRTILDNTVDAVIIIDENGMIELFNKAAESLFGYRAEQVFGKNVNLLMPEPYCSEHDSYLENYKKSGIRRIIGIGREVVGQRQTGSIFPMALAVGEIQQQGEQRRFVGILRNITERKRAEDALKQAKEQAEAANRAKSEFLSSMSHEIRTPMNAVIGFSDLLSSLITDKKQKSYLDSIITAGKSLLNLINDILDIAKIEAGRLDIQYEASNPALLFKELEQIFAIRIAEKGLEFIVEIDKELPPALLLDETRLRQVLLNLIGNAIKFTEKGYIKLSVQKIFKVDDLNQVDLIIAVADTGIGIPENQQEMIFESFRQQEGQSTQKYGGTGLGLAITKRLVEMMNGQIAVSSQKEQGSVFEIILRDVSVSATVPADKADNAFDFNNISFDQARVLVVDDIETNRILLKECLSKVNLDVVEAEDGQKAVLLTQKSSPDLILMDIRMPVMDGYEALQQLKNNPSTQHIPIIALTASVDSGEKAKIMSSDFDGFLSKPVNMPALFGELSHYLKHSGTSEPVTENEVPVDNLITWLRNIARFPDLIDELKNKVMPLWEDIGNGMLEIPVIEDFADTLVKRASEYKLPGLSHYADKLREYAQDFDIDNIEVILKEFIAITKKLSPKKGI